ncbi:hypothetical protein NKDENANG_01995 [Candidatus Entotheonellaceae bacterium PAL068K]
MSDDSKWEALTKLYYIHSDLLALSDATFLPLDAYRLTVKKFAYEVDAVRNELQHVIFEEDKNA